MVVVMQEGASEAQIQHVMEKLVALGFDIHRSTGVSRTVLGVVGGKVVDTREIELIDGVGEVIRITAPYKLASRQFNPEGTRIRLKNAKREVEIGSDQVVMMAGPCSVESEEQMEAVSEIVARCGAPILRGGAFKPRSSPYSFQGMGAAGSCEEIENRLLAALSVRRSARATLVERALRARFHLWIRRRDGSGLAQLNFFTASGAPDWVGRASVRVASATTAQPCCQPNLGFDEPLEVGGNEPPVRRVTQRSVGSAGT